MTIDDECKHGMAQSTCSLCSGLDKPAPVRGGGAGGSAQTLDTPAAVEKYRKYYGAGREATFEAYVDVFFRVSGARAFRGGFTNFARCANAEADRVEQEPDLVRRAEDLMRLGGYELDDSRRAARGGRRWSKSP